jgi:hypothetical protein
MAASTYLATALLDWIKGTTMPAAPSILYLQLHNGSPGVAGTSSIVQSTITGSANRTLVPQVDLGSVTPIVSGGFERVNANAIIVTSSSVNGASVFVSHVSLWTAITGGNCLQFDPIATTTEVRFGDLVKFDPSTFSVSCL